MMHTQPETCKLQQVCYHFATTCYNKWISGCVCISCDSLLATSLLQVFNRLVASWSSKLVIHRLAASCFNKLWQVYKWQVAAIDSLQFRKIDKVHLACWQSCIKPVNWQLQTSLCCFCLCRCTGTRNWRGGSGHHSVASNPACTSMDALPDPTIFLGYKKK